MPRQNWDDLRFVLAVAEAGSVSGAARRLGVNHATVLRRVAAYEAATGITVFDRSAQGYAVSADRRAVIEAAREVDAAVQALGHVLRGSLAPAAGEVRVTTTDSLGLVILPEVIAELRREAPELRIELVSSNAHVDLGRTLADISVRAALSLPAGLSGEAVAELGFGIYHAAGPPPEGWLGLSGQLAAAPVGRWYLDRVPDGRLTGAADSFLVLRELAARGLGRAILPCYAGESDARLRRDGTLDPPHLARIWVATHSDLAEVPRIARARDRIAQALRRRAAWLRTGIRA